MSSLPLIKIENLGKRYKIRSAEGKIKKLWFLKGVNLEVYPGDKISLTGENGSGKSTLFKLISEITDPSEGTISIRGRVSSILEVGVGFHFELTGRENIFLYGAFMGMNQEEIKNKFDLIVSFAEIEEFLETPIKKYSSGMQARLAFAVASHMHAEVFLVDEILSVCDSNFKEKAILHMKKLAKEGSAIIIVSHDSSLLKRLCDRVIRLDKGRLYDEGEFPTTVNNFF